MLILNGINNFTKWLALKPLLINKVSNSKKITILFIFFMKSIFSLVISTLTESIESLMILNKTRASNLLQKIFIKKCKEIFLRFMRKRNKADQVIKKIILKGNKTTAYVKNKHKNTGNSAFQVSLF